MQNSSGLIVIANPNQSSENRSTVLQWETEGTEALFPQRRRRRKKRAASQVEQRMSDEECYGDVEEGAKEGGGEEKARG